MNGSTCAFLLLAMATAAVAQQDLPRRIVRGHVVDETGAAIAGCAVALLDRAEAVDVRAMLREPTHTTDDDGRFELIVPAGRYRANVLLLAGRGRQAAARTLPYSREARVDLGQFVLPPAATLVGRVRDAAGEPLAGVQVSVTDAVQTTWNDQHRPRSGGVSNERGIFQVPCVPRTGLLLTVVKDGYATRELLASHDSPLTLTMQPAPLARGRLLTADGEPLADANLTIQHEGPRTRNLPIRRTDDDGSFAITVPATPERYRITATEAQKPHRRFESDLLRGGRDDVTFTEMVDAQEAGQELIVRVVDKATGEPLDRLSVATTGIDNASLQVAMFHADHSWRDYRQEARISLRNHGIKTLLVRAPGHAFERVTMPEKIDEPLVVELGPEAVLQGRVVDEAGAPVVGVAVRALPDGNSTGSSGSIGEHWPRTDAQGRYRIGSLQPGKYGVQVYPEQWPASDVFAAEVRVEEATTLDLTIPVQRRLTVEIVGDLPDGPLPTLRASRFQQRGGRNAGFRHSVTPPQPRPLRADERTFTFGPAIDDRASFELFVPSRTRVGAGTTLHLEGIEVDDGKARLELPDLQRHLVRGRIRVDGALPTARLAVLAVRDEESGPFRVFRNDKSTVGVFGDGTFQIDLPPGTYCIQLVDVTTGIVFHTEANDLEVGAETGELTLKPELHWLEVVLQDEDGAAARTHSFVVTLDRPRGGEQGAFLRSHRRRNQRDTQTVHVYGEATRHRWLVPAGQLDLDVNLMRSALQRGQRYYSTTKVTGEVLDIQRPEHRIVVEVPRAPTDAQLEKPADGTPWEDFGK
jgi:protocatechuate 3,4-dioxygenase beta subunit